MQQVFDFMEWDSEFFGFKVAKIPNNSIANNPCIILEDLYRNNINLCYYSSNTQLNDPIYKNKFYDIKLVVKRVPIVKHISKVTPFHDNITFYNKSFPDEDLIRLAQSAGKQGRFGNDSNIPKSKYEELFKNWIINSVNGQMASDILVYKVDGKIVGFTSLKIDKGIGYAPLFAVDREFEGKGVSFALMRAAETTFIKKGVKKVLSGTQEINKKAVKVYERYGFKILEPEYVYHLWKKDTE
jgi:dTDP-4-amino-4,6-dideoxy-D-galactose acyltransferase